MNMTIAPSASLLNSPSSSAEKAVFYEGLLERDQVLNSRVLARTQQIQGCMRRTVEELIALGAHLFDMRDDLKGNDAFGWRAWLAVENIGVDTANRAIHVFETFGDRLTEVQALPPSVLYELAKPSTTPELVEQALALHGSGGQVTVKSVREARKGQGISPKGHTFEEVQKMYLEDGWDGFEHAPPISKRVKYYCEFGLKQITFRGLDEAVKSRSIMQRRLQQLKEAVARPIESLGNVVPLRPDVQLPHDLNEEVGTGIVEDTANVDASDVTVTVPSVTLVDVNTVQTVQEPEKVVRMAHDYYPTDPRLVTSLFTEAHELTRIIKSCDTASFFEPCAGHGAIAERVERLFPGRSITTNEPYPIIKKFDEFRPTYQSDATNPDLWAEMQRLGLCDVSITNPPYEGDVMLPILQNAVAYSGIATAFLIRLGYLEPCQDRAEWLRENSDSLRY